MREFASRHSTGVRGIRLDKDDHLVDLALLDHVEATPAELRAYLKAAKAGDDEAIDLPDDEEEGEDSTEVTLTDRAFRRTPRPGAIPAHRDRGMAMVSAPRPMSTG